MLSCLPTLAAGALALNLVGTSAAFAQDRMPPIPPDKYDAAQKTEAEAFQVARKGPVFGPFSVLIRSPELMTAYRIQGDYLRLKPSIGTKLSELIILVTAREWTQDYEWYVHAPIALKRGISQEIIDAIDQGRRPTNMNEDQEIVYDFTMELHRNKHISDATYERASNASERRASSISRASTATTRLSPWPWIRRACPFPPAASGCRAGLNRQPQVYLARS